MNKTPKPATTNGLPASPGSSYDVHRVRADFPILAQTVQDKPLVYLDNAATTQKPQAVIDAISDYYRHSNANVHRAVHLLSQRATDAYEQSRECVRQFLGAASASEIIFTRGTTEAINLVAQSYGRNNLGTGDEILVTHLEHHSNIVPWQMVCQQTGAVLKVVPVTDSGELDMAKFEQLLSSRTRIVAIAHVSNALGTINPVKRIVESAHRAGAVVLIDGAQAVSHLKVDVSDLDCDFYAFSGHKLYGPTGIGALYAKTRWLEAMPPYQGGGDMIRSVSFENTTYNDPPYKFEAGTPNICGAIGMARAIDYLESLDMARITAYENDLLNYATPAISEVPGLRLIGTSAIKAAVLSFVIDHPPVASLDVGTQLDLQGIAVRTGHHCCEPLMKRFSVPGTVRASLGLYNTREEIDKLVSELHKISSKVTHKPLRAVSADPASATSAANESTELSFPDAAAASAHAAADQLAQDMALFSDWDERYQYLVELGEKLPVMPEEFKTPATRVQGCQSVVHMIARLRPGTSDVLDFLADSDASLVRGLIGLLQRLFSGQSAQEILDFDVDEFFNRVGLSQHLTYGRRNGLLSMVGRIHATAKEIAKNSAS